MMSEYGGNQGGGAGRRGSEQRALVRFNQLRFRSLDGMGEWGVRGLNSASDAFRLPSGVNEGNRITGRRLTSEPGQAEKTLYTSRYRAAEAGSAKRQNLRSEMLPSQDGTLEAAFYLMSWSFSSLW